MRVFEIKELLKEGKSLSDLIQLKSYIPFVEKKILCDKIIEGSLYEENGMLLCNYYDKKLFIEISIINNYTDIELDEENIVGDYDILCELGITEYILENMNFEESFFIYEMIGNIIKQKIKITNSVENILAKGLNTLLNKLPNDKQIKSIIKTASKELQKFEPEKLKSLQDMMKVVK
jgi:hypothetical protein